MMAWALNEKSLIELIAFNILQQWLRWYEKITRIFDKKAKRLMMRYPSTILVLLISRLLDKQVSQMRVLLSACCELAVDHNMLPELLYVFEHKN